MSSHSSPENMWVKFFTDAGLPSGISATYALIFTDNRIQMNMLLDLNKEYLREMGITCMGDVIAILRLAKQVHEETARDRVLSIAGPKVPVAAVTGRPGQPKPTTPATRMLEHYTRNSSLNVSPPVSLANVKDRLGAIHISGTKRKVISPSVLSDSMDKTGDIIASKYIRNTLAQKTVHEDNVDSKLVSQKKISPSVFSRLGTNEEVRSSTNSTVLSKVTVTGVKQVAKSSNGKTVFARLGGKEDDVSLRRDSSDSNEPLKYEGILKASAKKVVIKRPITLSTKPAKKLGTMRADEEPVSVKDKLPISHQQRKSVKFASHVDYREIEKLPAVKIVPSKPVVPNIRTVSLNHVTKVSPNKKIVRKTPLNVIKSNIKMRLGKPNQSLVKDVTKKTHSGVFSRLGITSKV